MDAKPQGDSLKKKPHPNKNRSKSQTRPGTSKEMTVQPANKNDKLNDSLKKILECPVCLKTMTSPIYVCENMHNLCELCSHKMSPPLCPICRSSMTFRRNRALEEMSSQLGTKCLNSKFGCEYVSVSENMEVHFDKCTFRQCYCPVGRELKQCSWTGSINELTKHFTDNHPSNMKAWAGKKKFINIDGNFQDVQLCSQQGGQFIYNAKVDISQNLVFWVIQFSGGNKPSQNWRYEFNINNPNQPAKNIYFGDVCRSLFDNINESYKSGMCIAVPLHVLKNYKNDKGFVTFKFFIHKINDEKSMNMKKVKENLPNVCQASNV